MKRAWLVSVVAAVMVAGSATAQVNPLTPTEFVSSAGVNLLRHVDVTTGKLDTRAEFLSSEFVNFGGVQYGAYQAMDGSLGYAQVNFQSASASNAASLLFTLASPQVIGTLTQTIFTAGEIPAEYRVRASNSPDGPWTTLTGGVDGWQVNNSVTLTTVFNDANTDNAYQYIQIDYKSPMNVSSGVLCSYMRIAEIVASPKENATIGITDGYSLMNLSSAQGGPGPIPNDPLYFGGWRVGNTTANANGLVNNNPLSHGLVQENKDVLQSEVGDMPNFFVLPLNDLYSLVAFSMGSVNLQQWTGFVFEYTADETITANTDWKLAYMHANFDGEGKFLSWKSFDTLMVAFEDPILARYVKISAPYRASGDGMMGSFELFAGPIPEPATMTLLALGGLAMLRRART